eukprot:gb/GECH01005356.1/.p1 GENE.gb/GECH01005356.1/~~gb/GECH01005356.1/.p1  ORF type:complete len:422 (+),score=81.98 gb/GECH01005356.1/:1-1266(+)
MEEGGSLFWLGGVHGKSTRYSNWIEGREPNNADVCMNGEQELYVHMKVSDSHDYGKWNDMCDSTGHFSDLFRVDGYMVEFGGRPNDPSVGEGLHNVGNITIQIPDRCPLGNRLNSGTCEPCELGTFCNSHVCEACIPCPLGTVSTTEGETECSPCPPGTHSSESRDQCYECSPGTFCESEGCGSCDTCPENEIALSSGQASCVPCDGKDTNECNPSNPQDDSDNNDTPRENPCSSILEDPSSIWIPVMANVSEWNGHLMKHRESCLIIQLLNQISLRVRAEISEREKYLENREDLLEKKKEKYEESESFHAQIITEAQNKKQRLQGKIESEKQELIELNEKESDFEVEKQRYQKHLDLIAKIYSLISKGEQCHNDYDCQEKEACDYGVCRLKAGFRCSEHTECISGLHCRDSVCFPSLSSE